MNCNQNLLAFWTGMVLKVKDWSREYVEIVYLWECAARMTGHLLCSREKEEKSFTFPLYELQGLLAMASPKPPRPSPVLSVETAMPGRGLRGSKQRHTTTPSSLRDLIKKLAQSVSKMLMMCGGWGTAGLIPDLLHPLSRWLKGVVQKQPNCVLSKHELCDPQIQCQYTSSFVATI